MPIIIEELIVASIKYVNLPGLDMLPGIPLDKIYIVRWLDGVFQALSTDSACEVWCGQNFPADFVILFMLSL